MTFFLEFCCARQTDGPRTQSGRLHNPKRQRGKSASLTLFEVAHFEPATTAACCVEQCLATRTVAVVACGPPRRLARVEPCLATLAVYARNTAPRRQAARGRLASRQRHSGIQTSVHGASSGGAVGTVPPVGSQAPLQKEPISCSPSPKQRRKGATSKLTLRVMINRSFPISPNQMRNFKTYASGYEWSPVRNFKTHASSYEGGRFSSLTLRVMKADGFRYWLPRLLRTCAL
jgi:hypothetical protein